MKILRLAAILLLVLGTLLSGAVLALLANKDRLIRAVLQGVEERTGYRITTGPTHIRLSSHLILEFDQPKISRDGRQILNIDTLRAVVSYHSILFARGMPLYSLVLVRPEIQLPQAVAFAANIPLPRIGTELAATIIKLLDNLERAAWRIETVDAKIYASDGRVLFDELGILAFRRHREPHLWRAEFAVRVMQPPFEGFRSNGRIKFAGHPSSKDDQIARVYFYFWNDRTTELALSTARLQGRVSGRATLALARDGTATGSLSLALAGVLLKAEDSSATEQLGDYTLQVKYSESVQSIELGRVRLVHDQVALASGDAELSGIADQKPVLTVHLGASVPLKIETIRSQLRFFREVPANVTNALNQVRSGRLLLSSVSLATTPEKLLEAPDVAIRDGIDISAVLEDVSFPLPQDLKLPAVQKLSAQLRYAHNTMSATQGSAILDQSSFSEVSARLDFAKKFDALAYQLSFNFDANLAQLYPAVMEALERLKVEARKQIRSLAGRVTIRSSASGSFKLAAPVLPTVYRASFEANRATLVAAGAPGPIEFASGSVTLEPGKLRLSRLALKTTGGYGMVDGTLGLDHSGAHVRDVTVELHDMPAGVWLALAVDPDAIRVAGPAGGKVRIEADSSRPGTLLVNGRLVISAGSVQFGFLRAPMEIRGATVRFTGRSMAVNLPSSVLEGSPIDFRMTIADLSNPTMRIEASVARLDFEVMKFIRLPWSPANPPAMFPIPVNGHIEAHDGNLSKLQMSSIKTDFWRINGDWKVYNFTANAFNGSAELEISGRAKDNWIHIQSKMSNMDISAMFLLPGDRTESPIIGKTWVAADLRADTNGNFFETLEGRASLTLRNGLLNRFKLLSRLLSLIDLKSWLTARFPDPTVNGLPFDTIFFDLKGDQGVFDTEKFLLQGPVMDISATGNLNLAQSSMDMELAAFPLSTFNWVLSKIPIIGTNMADSAGTVVAAYVRAYGPVSDPSVTPMPITSVAEIIKKMLFLPINVIRPNTVQ
ncbi:MAG TPA: AsmA-like C-terminal domain-containing protein [Candidatus Binataceae bacterium]|nr:AsmA-like C-terminal domain-containing protein [Candidatus Binataceae bacterium]